MACHNGVLLLIEAPLRRRRHRGVYRGNDNRTAIQELRSSCCKAVWGLVLAVYFASAAHYMCWDDENNPGKMRTETMNSCRLPRTVGHLALRRICSTSSFFLFPVTAAGPPPSPSWSSVNNRLWFVWAGQKFLCETFASKKGSLLVQI